MDHRSPVLGLIGVCLCTATPAAARDKRALIEKLMVVSNISGQLQSGAQGATAQIMSLLSHPHVGDPKPPASRSQSASQVTSELLVADGVGIAVDFVPAQRGLRLALIGWSWPTSLQEVARQ